ncbi:AAA family ATPase [Arcicella rigui]|uniref:AAA family ATPase n=1 Tax=Arcicella rigui TaxID=797020 RepID=A0ABU5Q6J4_9BACT|nr:AAA family ATPase [Arcicella rigui]MEA5138450.1 AAA family ATPase [Arcicella rigui]
MIIDELGITNFKNFDNINVSFSSGVNLFVGGNGSGKTSLLEAINVALGGFFSSQPQKMHRVIEFDEIKITKGKRELSTTIFAKSSLIEKGWSRTKNRDTKSNDNKEIDSIKEYGKKFFQAFEVNENKDIAPLIAYYSTQRLFKDARLSTKQTYDAAFGRRNGYLQCLEENAIKTVLKEWLGNAVTRRATLQIKDILGKTDFVLENVEEAIKETLILFLDLPEDFPLKIYQEPYFNNEVFIYFDEEHDLPLNYYSDGFRNLLYLIIDLVWRASQLNPWLTLNEISENITGVVTIDEIDLHLHPKWQAKSIDIIQKLFPNVQFFITTHSPTVVANFQHGTLYLIDNNQVQKYESEFFGKQVNSVLRNVLGAYDRHIPTQNKLNQLFRLIDENQFAKADILLNELTQLLGFEDFEISKAIALLEWQKSMNQV